MRRWAQTSAVLLLAAGSALALPLSASAAPPSCQGTPATIVGTPGESLAGTSGPDVVVTNGATDISSGNGDDLVCLTDGPGGPPVDGDFVSVGAGDDVVDARGSGSTLVGADLGTGADSYVGGPGSDVVNAGLWFEEDAEGPDEDVVVTGDGADRVTTGGRPTHADADQIDLGDGPDVLTVFGDTSADGVATGGSGRDTVEIERATRRGEWLITQGADLVSVSGHLVARWNEMEDFHVIRLPAGSSVRFTGGGGDDHLTVLGAPTTAVMGPGDDVVDVEAGPRMLAGGLFVDGGAGEDRLRIDRAPTVALDLTTGRLRFGEATGNPRQTRALRLENADVLTSGAIRLIGTSGPNRLRYAGCSGSVSAKGGDDVLEFRANADLGCEDGMDLPVGGGAGDDALVGGRQDDHLVGGAGRDRADGRSGRDVCVAETTRRCEA